MQILALDKDFKTVGTVKFLNLQWNSEYYTAGDFSLQILAKYYKDTMAYIYNRSRRETGRIEKVEYAETSQGAFVQLSGFFMESILNDKPIYPSFFGKGKIEESVRECVLKNKSDIPLLELGELNGYSETADWSEEKGRQLGKVLNEVLEPHEMTYHCTFDYTNNKIQFSLYKGLDRTKSQTSNNYVVFSKGFKNLSGAKIDMDSSNLYNHAIVVANGENPIVVEVDLSAGEYKKTIVVDCKSTKHDTAKQSLVEFKESLKQKGLEKLERYKIVQNFEIDVSNSSFRYLKDFDIGDKVDVVIDALNLQLECRVVAVKEVVKQNNHTITIELGNKKVTELQKARLI